MNKNDLIKLLEELSKNDLSSGSDVYDHPCSVAVRAINQYSDDVAHLCQVVRGDLMGHPKRTQKLISNAYNPNW